MKLWLLLRCEILGDWTAGVNRRIWMMLQHVYVGSLSTKPWPGLRCFSA